MRSAPPTSPAPADMAASPQRTWRAVSVQAASPMRVAHTPIRRRVAEHMARSLAEAPHVTTLFEADLTRVQAHRSRHAAQYERQGTRLTLTAYFVAACARALASNPSVNATIMRTHSSCIPTPHRRRTALGNEGLIVPVIHAARSSGCLRSPASSDSSSRRPRGQADPQDCEAAPFTLSNHGVSGSLLAAPSSSISRKWPFWVSERSSAGCAFWNQEARSPSGSAACAISRSPSTIAHSMPSKRTPSSRR